MPALPAMLIREVPPRPADRPVPYQLEAEAALLAAILNDPPVLLEVAGRVQPRDFFGAEYGTIFQVMLDLAARRIPASVLMVAGELKQRGQLDAIGGAGALTALRATEYMPDYVAHYTEVVTRLSLLRQCLTVGGAIGALAYGVESDPARILSWVHAAVASLYAGAPDPAQSLGRVADAVLADISHRQAHPGVAGVPTGFPTLDSHVYGWEPGQLILLAARTSRGKTALAQHFAEAAGRAGVPTAILSLEMEPAELARRHLARASRTDLTVLRRAAVGEADWTRLVDAQAALTALPIWFLDLPRPTLAALETTVQRMQADPARGCGLLIVDYLQLLPSDGGNREQEVAAVSRGLKALARACHIPVIALSQFSRAAEDRERPELRDLRESGAQEQDANIVLALHRPDPTVPARVDLHILKQRDGEADGLVSLTWHGGTQTFAEVPPPPIRDWSRP